MTAITDEEMTPEKWCNLLGFDLNWYRQVVQTDPVGCALDTLARELWVSRQRALARARELMLDEDSHAAYVAVAELWQLLGGDTNTPEQLRQVHEQMFNPRPVVADATV